jgi:hypothetical protein
VGSFEGLEAVHGRVVLGVGPLGRVEDVVEVLVVAEEGAELLELLVGSQVGRGLMRGFGGHEEIIGSAIH